MSISDRETIEAISRPSMYGAYGTFPTGEIVTSLLSTFDDTVQRAARDFERRCPYGVSGVKYNPHTVEGASSVTMAGRRLMKELEAHMEKHLDKIIYGDVDSVFYSHKDDKEVPEEVKGSFTKKCNKCDKVDEKLQRCARCKKTYYCGIDCQKADWKLHRETCAIPK